MNLNDILITGELYRRSPRPSNSQREASAFRSLAQQLGSTATAVLDMLVRLGVELCQAGSCGLSVLDIAGDAGQTFQWKAMAGVYAPHAGGTTPRNFSPCGATLDRRSPQLFYYPERVFTYFQAVTPPIVEGLVLPLYYDGLALGTIWVVSHDEQRKFDSEDVRVMNSLGYFTTAALHSRTGSSDELLHASG